MKSIFRAAVRPCTYLTSPSPQMQPSMQPLGCLSIRGLTLSMTIHANAQQYVVGLERHPGLGCRSNWRPIIASVTDAQVRICLVVCRHSCHSEHTSTLIPHIVHLPSIPSSVVIDFTGSSLESFGGHLVRQLQNSRPLSVGTRGVHGKTEHQRCA